MSDSSSGSEVTMSGGSCPRGVTFGDTITLSPSGERVINPHTAYFNNGDYVVIWTEVGSNGPRIEFQLFNSSNNRIGCTDNCSGELVSDRKIKIGTTAVGVYEDYTFLVVWSLLERSQAPWKININAYRYNVSDSSYMILPSPISSSIEISANTKGKYGFSTLSLDNGFILAYMSLVDDKQFIISSYKKEEDKDSYIIKSITEKVSNPLLGREGEVIVKTVPTQYFFSVILSLLAGQNSITIKNYKIEDMSRIVTKTIDSNPRSIYADLSYDGTLTVAWEEISMSCETKYHPVYKAQMFSDTSALGSIFQISDQINNAENTNTYLQQVITQSKSRLIATFLRENESGSNDKYIVKIFDNGLEQTSLGGSMVLGGAVQTPATPSNHAFEAMTDPPNTPSPIDANCPRGDAVQGRLKRKREREGDDKQVENMQLEIPIPRQGDCPASVIIPSIQTDITNDLDQFIKKYTFVTQKNSLIQSRYGVLYQTFIDGTVEYDIGQLKKRRELSGYQYYCDCTREDVYLFLDNDKVHYCPPFLALSKEPSTQHLYHSQFTILAAFASLPNGERMITISYDECITPNKPLSCAQYYFAAIKSLERCAPQSLIWAPNINICNFTTISQGNSDISYQQKITLALRKIYEALEMAASGDSLPSDDIISMAKYLFGQNMNFPVLRNNVLNAMLNSIKGTNSYLIADAYITIIPCSTQYSDARTVGVFPAGSSVYLCVFNSLDSILNSEFNEKDLVRTLAHEMSHSHGTQDDFAIRQNKLEKIYGYQKCNEYATSSLRIPAESSQFIPADCVGLYIKYIVCKQDKSCINIPQTLDRKFHPLQNNIKEENMPNTTDIKLELEVRVLDRSNIQLTCILRNLYTIEIYIPARANPCNNMDMVPFYFSGLSEIICYKRYFGTHNELNISMPPNSMSSQTINLSNYCSFELALPGLYKIHSQGVYEIYSDRELTSNLNIVHLYSEAEFYLDGPRPQMALITLPSPTLNIDGID